MEEEKQGNKPNKAKIALIFLIIGTVGMGATLTWVLYSKPSVACNTSANTTDLANAYNAGYYSAIADMVKEAYGNGIVRIPYNSTHNFALVPWREENG